LAPPPVRQPAEIAKPPEPKPQAAPRRRSSKDTLPATPRAENPAAVPSLELTAPEPPQVETAPVTQGPKEMPPGSWEAPPIRRVVSDISEPPPIRRDPTRETASSEVPEWPTTSDHASHADSEPLPPRRRSRALWIMAAMLLVGTGIGVWAWSFGTGVAKESEDKLAQKAKDAYDEDNYGQASRFYRQLQTQYEFWEDFSNARNQVKLLDVDADPALESLRAFLAKHRAHPLLKQYDGDVWQCYTQLLLGKLLPDERDGDIKVTTANVDKVEANLQKAREVKTESDRYAPKDVNNKEIEERMSRVAIAVAAVRSLRGFIARLDKIDPTWDNITKLEREADALGLLGHKDVIASLQRLRDRMMPDVQFKPGGVGQQPRPEDTAATLLVAPRLDRGDGRAPAGIVFALARGVLYALDAKDGQVRWARRVGIDTATLPVRVPAGEINAELVLVLSSDTNTLTACDVQSGEALWSYHLGQPCLGRPVLVGRRAYVATIDGHVHEIEIVRGQVLGRFDLGLPLSGGGTHQEGTNLVYFPAEVGFLFVLDVEQRKCVGVLQTGHPAGSLRGEPLIVTDGRPMTEGSSPPRYLILSQADGLDTMKLRAYRLPIDKVMKVAPLQPEPRVRGWSWFPPHCDGEKVVLATDAGVLGLFGIKQPNNDDPPLFALLPRELQLDGDDAQPGRAQVVHAAGDDDFWVLARGQLQHWRKGLTKDGLKVSSMWAQPLVLGSPLHAGQVNEAQDTLFVVTQSAARQACLATAIDAATGAVRWQRQLGLTALGDPRTIGGRVAVLDQGGGAYVFDPETRYPYLLPRTSSERTGAVVWFQPAADGQSAYALVVPAPDRLALRRYGIGKKATEAQGLEFPGTLGGTPALGNGCVLLPLTDGTVLRLALTSGARPDDGPHWRAPHADPTSRGHVVWLGGDDFLITDGSRGLQRFRVPGKLWEAIDRKKQELQERIVGAPLLLSPGDEKNPLQLAVGDTAGNIIFLEEDRKKPDGSRFKEVRRWALGGKITAGPFLRGDRIGCVLDRRELVWIDPTKALPLWWRCVCSNDGIVGQPQLIGDSIVVADLAGRFLALDPKSGDPRGSGYTLKASAAPAGAPVAFGKESVFAPLTDGTVLLLSLEQLTGDEQKPK